MHKSEVKAVAAAVDIHLNNLLKIESQCAHLRIKSVKKAMMEGTGEFDFTVLTHSNSPLLFIYHAFKENF